MTRRVDGDRFLILMDNSQLTQAERKATCEALQTTCSLVTLPGEERRYLEIPIPMWWGSPEAPPDLLA